VLTGFLPGCAVPGAQDASTASLVWVLTLMAEHPDVLERVRAEQAAARPDLNATITGETLAQMPYTRQVSLLAVMQGCANIRVRGIRTSYPSAFGAWRGWGGRGHTP
jgi:hypothetical protein